MIAMARGHSVEIVAIGAVAIGAWLMNQYPEPAWYPVRAEVTRISVMNSEGHRTRIVGLRTPTGVGEARFVDRLVACQIGDIVDAEQAGVAIRQSPTTCS